MKSELINFEAIPENVIIANQENLQELLRVFREQGLSKIHVLADFDRTLTKLFVKGEKIPSIQAILRDGNYLTKEYAEKAHQLFAIYHPIEVDPKIPFAEKKNKMLEWWRVHNQLMIESGLNIKDIEGVVNSGKIVLRLGTGEFLTKLEKENIPLIIMSASGLGNDAITMLLKNEQRLSNNIHIISNSIEYDADGKAIKFNEPIIHGMNKDETVIKDFPEIFNQVSERKNVIMLGDNIEDLEMVTGFDYDNLIKIGFLNDNVDEHLEDYRKNFDVVILNDGDMNFVNKLIEAII